VEIRERHYAGIAGAAPRGDNFAQAASTKLTVKRLPIAAAARRRVANDTDSNFNPQPKTAPTK